MASGAEQETERTRRRYDRIAPVYDLLEGAMERRFRLWRRELWALVEAGETLAMGVGTGKNLPFHPRDGRVIGLDISAKMLKRGLKRKVRLGASVKLQVADVQSLPHEDGRFDTAVATFLFCSVPDPVRGLREARRILRRGGRLLLLEHVLSERALLRCMMRWLDPIPAHVWGAHIDRDTVTKVRKAGFENLESHDLLLDVVKIITARAP